MGYLNNEEIMVDAIITKKGRELLSRGDGSFKITRFALSDDEVNYNLFNDEHPQGSSHYGELIEDMPIMEAFADENYALKYKLITLPLGTTKVPILSIGYETIVLSLGGSVVISPETLNFTKNTESFYTYSISDLRLVSTFEGIGGLSTSPTNPAVSRENISPAPSRGDTRERVSSVLRRAPLSEKVKGTSLRIMATNSLALFPEDTNGDRPAFIEGNVIIEGGESGARLSIPIKINRSVASARISR